MPLTPLHAKVLREIAAAVLALCLANPLTASAQGCTSPPKPDLASGTL